MVKIVQIDFGRSMTEVEDDKEILWNLIMNPEFDWNTPLLVRDSTNPMNDMILNMEHFVAIKRFDRNEPKI